MKTFYFLAFIVTFLSLSFTASSWAESRDELVLRVAKQGNISEDQARSEINRVFSAIEAELKDGRNVTIKNFGRFSLSNREARKGRNPRTGAVIDIPAKKYPRFLSADGFKQRMNETAPLGTPQAS